MVKVNSDGTGQRKKRTRKKGKREVEGHKHGREEKGDMPSKEEKAKKSDSSTKEERVKTASKRGRGQRDEDEKEYLVRDP